MMFELKSNQDGRYPNEVCVTYFARSILKNIATVWGLSCMVCESTEGSVIRANFSASIFESKKAITPWRKSAPCAVTLSVSHLSRFKYSRRDARAATSRAKAKGRLSKRWSKIYNQRKWPEGMNTQLGLPSSLEPRPRCV